MRLSLAALCLLLLAATPTARGHDFQESRRVVLSVAERSVAIMVAYELRPSPLADSLWARFDSDGDRRVTTDAERLARAQVILPRLRQGLRFELGGHTLPWPMERLELDSPREGGRPGVTALALFRAPLPGDSEATRALAVYASRPRGQLLLEAQAERALWLRSDELPRRDGDPVHGPVALSGDRAVTVRFGPRRSE